MSINTFIKTEPTTMADNEIEVNIYDVEMNILLITSDYESILVVVIWGMITIWMGMMGRLKC